MSAKIDAWVLFLAETVVTWRKQTKEADEKLTIAEYLSELVRVGAVPVFESAKAWLAKQSTQGPKTTDGEASKRKGKAT